MTFFYRPPVGSLLELRVGQNIVINGQTHRVTAINVAPAEEDDPDLGIQIGDLVTTVTFDEETSRT